MRPAALYTGGRPGSRDAPSTTDVQNVVRLCIVFGTLRSSG